MVESDKKNVSMTTCTGKTYILHLKIILWDVVLGVEDIIKEHGEGHKQEYYQRKIKKLMLSSSMSS